MGAGMALLAGLARRKRKLALIAALLVPASVGMASDGVLEINETCAQVGCFNGDSPGWPVTISRAGSYRLTGNLNIPDENTSGIVVTADHVRIDLNNFAIIGPGTCSGTPLVCTLGSGLGVGIRGYTADYSAFYRGTSVKNGTIKGMGWAGMLLSSHAEVTNLRVQWNRLKGISAASGSTISGNAAFENGGTGIGSGWGTTVSGNTANFNGGTGISAGRGSVVSGNAAWGNHEAGIAADEGSTVSGNAASTNGSDGIRVDEGSTVSGNTMRGNTGNGLRFIGSDSAYSGNVISSNTAGTITGSGVEFGQNVCDGNTTCP